MLVISLWYKIVVFECFLCPRANRSRHSLLINLTWGNCSCRSLQKSDREQFAQIAHDKRVTGVIRSFSQANCSFAYKKWANRSKNRWANSQPWKFVNYYLYLHGYTLSPASSVLSKCRLKSDNIYFIGGVNMPRVAQLVRHYSSMRSNEVALRRDFWTRKSRV